MRPLRAAVFAGPSVLVACSQQESVPALFVPDSIDVFWNEAWNDDEDGLAMLVPVDVMAYDAATGAPIADLVVSLEGVRDDATDIEILAVDDVVWWTSADSRRTGRAAPEESWWDARRDAFFELSEEGAGAVPTDLEGVARFYLLVDTLPTFDHEPAGGAGTPVTATLGDTQETFLLVSR
jgi:hypothetical protein